MKFHPLADIFPLFTGDELQALADDIKTNGQREPIVVFKKQILDGRNRWMACRLAKVEPEFEEFEGTDREALAFVISINLRRRHMSESQRAWVAAQMARLPRGGRRNPQNWGMSADEAALQFNVSTGLIEYARAVRERDHAGLNQAVELDRIPVSAAAKLVEKDDESIAAVIAKIMAGQRPQEAMRLVKAEQTRRSIDPLSGKYRVLLADPPWSYGNTQPDYHSEQRDHYPVMTIKDICAMPIQDITQDDAVLFLWVTSPILRDAFAVIDAWGFEYKASFVWDKIRHNMGHYNSVRHEFLLVCVRGSCQPDNQFQRQLFDSVQSIEATEHSRKPAIFYDIIEALYPVQDDPVIHCELFLRGEPRPGWASYGYEVAEKADAA